MTDPIPEPALQGPCPVWECGAPAGHPCDGGMHAERRTRHAVVTAAIAHNEQAEAGPCSTPPCTGPTPWLPGEECTAHAEAVRAAWNADQQPPEPKPYPGLPKVQGHCPACRRESLFLGDGGYPTCAQLECPDPCAASDLLERVPQPDPELIRAAIADAVNLATGPLIDHAATGVLYALGAVELPPADGAPGPDDGAPETPFGEELRRAGVTREAFDRSFDALRSPDDGSPNQSPAAAVEVRDPCPYCGDRQMIPRSQRTEHVARLHPDVREGTATAGEPLPCTGFPDNCPNLRDVPPDIPRHEGGIRCGCADPAPQSDPQEKHCGIVAAHPRHKYMQWGRVDRCPGNAEAPAPDATLREKIAAAIQALNEGGGWLADLDNDDEVYVLVDAVMAVRDRELEQAREELAEARMWARHGYELGQRSCTWADHGVAPAWLTDNWATP